MTPPRPSKEKWGCHIHLLKLGCGCHWHLLNRNGHGTSNLKDNLGWHQHFLNIRIHKDYKMPTSNMLYYAALYYYIAQNWAFTFWREVYYGFQLHLLKWHVDAKSYSVYQEVLCLCVDLAVYLKVMEVASPLLFRRWRWHPHLSLEVEVASTSHFRRWRPHPCWMLPPCS